jgi:DNA gyrase/topoisomerase IV subunit B
MTSKQGKRLNPFQHALQRPDTYIGSIKTTNREMWVYQEPQVPEEEEPEEDAQPPVGSFVLKPIKYNQGLTRIFVELMSNVIDNKWRSDQHSIPMKKVEFILEGDPESDRYGWITVTNDGYGIPVEKAEYQYEDFRNNKTITEELYPAEVFFGEMLAGTNFEEDATRKTSGRNGMGAKAGVVFSKEFVVDHANIDQQKRFLQTYRNNGKERDKPKITSYKAKTNYTSISMLPDYERFGYPGMDEDLFSLFKRYIYEAAMITGLGVTLNGEKIVVKDLIKFAKLFYPDAKENHMIHLKAPNGDECVLVERGIPDADVAEDVSHLSWVNGINTRDGGIHVGAWRDAIFGLLVRTFNARKPKKGEKEALKASAKELYPYFVVFVRCEASGAGFDSQTKDRFTSYKHSEDEERDYISLAEEKKDKKIFGDSLAEAIKKMLKWNFVSLLEEKLTMRAERAQAKKEGTKRKVADGKGIQNANFAGTKDAWKCTLFITEGLSAKAFADRLISSIEEGTNYYGSFAIRGKFINAQKFSVAVVNANEEVKQLKGAMGLRVGETYTDLRDLRYGKVCFMTDQDDDGLHIRGLLLNFFWHFWPSLFDLTCEDGSPYLMFESFTTMVTMARWGKNMKMFYSNPEFHEWFEKEGSKLKGLKIKYYKGLGTHVPGDEMLYLEDQKKLQYTLDGDEGEYMTLGFADKQSDWRKLWITRDMVKPGEIRLSEEEIVPMLVDGEISLSVFVDQQLIIYHKMALRRALPSLYDGLKEAQRKILYGVETDSDARKAPVVVETLAGSVKRIAGYHHGGSSLEDTMIGMAQGFVGSNNIPLLVNGGEMGCVDPETSIILWNGKFKKAKDVTLTDKLIGDDGSPRNISKIVKGKDTMYKISQLYGDTYRVNSKHILTLYFPGHKQIYWKDASKKWYMEYYDEISKTIKTKSIGIENGTTRYNSAHFTKEEAHAEIQKFASSIPDSSIIDIDIQSYLKMRKSLRASLYAAENRSVVQWKKKDVTIDPYILGMWLGDGRANGRGFASADAELVKEWVIWTDTIGVEVVHYSNPEGREGYQYGLRRRGTSMNNRNKTLTAVGDARHSSKTCIGCQTSTKVHPACDWIYHQKSNESSREFDWQNSEGYERDDFNPFKILLQGYNLVENKYIPEDYIFNDEQTRLKLLAGYIDTDGTKRDNCFEISQEEKTHGHLIDSIQLIARSLGFRTVVSVYISRRPNGGTSNMKTIRIYGDISKIPTKLVRKQMEPGTWIRRHSTITVEEDGTGQYVGWHIDKNERFLLGDFTITHNTRSEGGDDAAAARYPETCLEEIAWSIFSKMDWPLLEQMEENGKKVEPRFYMPCIPMVLINGQKGIASGYSCDNPNYNPEDVVDRIEDWLENDSITLPPLVPWYRGFTGTIELVTRKGKTGAYEVWDPASEEKPTAWRSKGILEQGKGGWWHIKEIPVGVWTNKVKEHLAYLETGERPKGSKKKKKKDDKQRYLLDVRWMGTTNTAVWDIKPTKDFIPDMDVADNLKILQTVSPLTNIHVIDEHDYPRKYSCPEDLLTDFCPKRLEFYERRKDYWLGEYEKDLEKESDRYKFVKSVVDKKLNMYQQDDKLEADMLKLGLRKISTGKENKDGEIKESFDYLLSMQMRSMTVKRLEEIKKDVDNIKAKIDELSSKSAKDLWKEDLAAFRAAYAKFLKTRKEETDSKKKIKMK